LLALVIACLVVGTARAQEAGSGLNPGGKANLNERVPINFVFVGYEPDDVNGAQFLAGLPEEYRPVVRSRLFYGASREQAALGINYTYDKRVFFADDAYATRFFDFLRGIARPADLTLYQQEYNDQENNAVEVGGNHLIDAPTVEQYLLRNAPAGVDTSRDTIFFINWWGDGEEPRPGFLHHVYEKTDEPDPDTGYNFGAERDSRKVIAWGGTAGEDEENRDVNPDGRDSRVWFYDLSAGPESWTNNWNVDDADLDGDGEADERIPPVWEYFAEGGYRPASALSGDLAKVARYAAINLMFTPSPLYPPGFTPRLLPDRINLDVNTVEGIDGVDASTEYQTPELILDEVSEVHDLPYTIDQQDLAYSGKAAECYVGLLNGTPCYRQYKNYPAGANLFLFGAQSLGRLVDKSEYRQYQAVLLSYAVEDGGDFETSPPFLGFADDNYRNGTQSFVFSFLSPSIIGAGYGLSTTEIHEYGHHLNFSHPHDGYDYERDLDYGPSGEFQYAWSGDEQNSMMSYIDLNWDFSQFDQDNNDRFQAAAYLNNANSIAADIQASKKSGAAQTDLAAANRYATQAQAAIARHDYGATFQNARLAYESTLAGAQKAGIKVTASDDGRKAFPGNRKGQAIPPNYIDKDYIGPGSKRWQP
jgi:hypothetical protein